ncbi:hypothetical protein F5887DRAFT_839458, partial [Amanita rubescens]
TPNPWLTIIETSLTYLNAHLIKLQRALAHFGALLGSRSRELDGGELLDVTLFIKVAELTAKRVGRAKGRGRSRMGFHG